LGRGKREGALPRPDQGEVGALPTNVQRTSATNWRRKNRTINSIWFAITDRFGCSYGETTGGGRKSIHKPPAGVKKTVLKKGTYSFIYRFYERRPEKTIHLSTGKRGEKVKRGKAEEMAKKQGKNGREPRLLLIKGGREVMKSKYTSPTQFQAKEVLFLGKESPLKKRRLRGTPWADVAPKKGETVDMQIRRKRNSGGGGKKGGSCGRERERVAGRERIDAEEETGTDGKRSKWYDRHQEKGTKGRKQVRG